MCKLSRKDDRFWFSIYCVITAARLGSCPDPQYDPASSQRNFAACVRLAA
jgi:hypothetical protein